VFKERGGFTFKNYDLACSKLSKANAQVVMTGAYGVLSSRSYAWISLAVADRDNEHIVNSYSGQNQTRTHDYASDDKARELLWLAINDTLNKWVEDGLDNALAKLEDARQSIRKPAAQR